MSRRGWFSPHLITAEWFSPYAKIEGWWGKELLDPPAGGTVYTITCTAGSYSLTGQTATVIRSRLLNASQGSYTVTGQTVTLLKSKLIAASQGTYSLSGQTATITYTPSAVVYTITALNGTYNVTGQSATLLRSKVLNASQGSYSYTGQSSTITRNRNLSASYGAYTLTGKNVAITYSTPYPSPSDVLSGVVYGPGGVYVGTLVALDNSIKIDIKTGVLVKPLSNKLVTSL